MRSSEAGTKGELLLRHKDFGQGLVLSKLSMLRLWRDLLCRTEADTRSKPFKQKMRLAPRALPNMMVEDADFPP